MLPQILPKEKFEQFVGFLMADNIASSLGIKQADPQRLAAGTLYTLNQLTISGHCCYPINEFTTKCAETLRVESDIADKGVEEAIQQGFILYNIE